MKKILIIEDTDFISENIAITLKFEGYETAVARDGLEGLKAIEEHKPDLILCDVSMPGLDGYGVLEKVRKNKSSSTIPFVFLTAKAEKVDMRRGMSLGADDYLTKPFTTEELITAVKTRLDKMESIDQHYGKKMEELRGKITYALPHEFRTALGGILGYADLLIENAKVVEAGGGSIDPKEVQDLASEIKSSARRLHGMTENFLVYTQIQTIASIPEEVAQLHRYTLEHTAEVIPEVVRFEGEKYERRNDIDMEHIDGAVQISSQNLYKIISELVDNAFKFSKEGDVVVVNAGPRDDQYYAIEITDKGRGMTAEQIKNIGAYNQFQRDLYEQQGAGLGLVIAKLLVELHKGRLIINSVLDQGTTVIVELPLVS